MLKQLKSELNMCIEHLFISSTCFVYWYDLLSTHLLIYYL